MNPDRYVLPHLPKPARRLIAERVERLYFNGMTFEQAMDRATELLR